VGQALPIVVSSNSEGSKKLPDDGRLLPKHVGASIWNKRVVQSLPIVVSSNSEGSKKIPDDGRLLPKHVGANI
jgi:hypothetical protein